MVEFSSRAAAPAETGVRFGPYVDWAAIIAGAVLASAIAFVLLAFGAAIGLTATSPFEGKGISGTALAVAIAMWVLLVEIFSFAAGGYLAGRLRQRLPEATEAEVDMRDAWHGLLVWAVGTLIGAWLAASVLSGAAKASLDAARSVGTSAATAPTHATANASDAAGYVADKMLRVTATATEADPEVLHGEVVRVLGVGAARGAVSSDDRAYLAQLVAARTGLMQAEADKRVSDVLTQAEAAVKAAADRARTASILLGFLTAASLLASAAAAWESARSGGRHRDQAIAFDLFRRK
jgi:hypothetical protein